MLEGLRGGELVGWGRAREERTLGDEGVADQLWG